MFVFWFTIPPTPKFRYLFSTFPIEKTVKKWHVIEKGVEGVPLSPNSAKKMQISRRNWTSATPTPSTTSQTHTPPSKSIIKDTFVVDVYQGFDTNFGLSIFLNFLRVLLKSLFFSSFFWKNHQVSEGRRRLFNQEIFDPFSAGEIALKFSKFEIS